MDPKTTVQHDLLALVQEDYIRFGQGDIAGIIATLADDIVWTHAGNPDILPFAGTFRGKDGVMEFFQRLAESSQITVFKPSNFRREGNQVMNDLYVEATVLHNGKTSATSSTVTNTFNADGQTTHWELVGDMSPAEAAFQ